MFIAAAGVVVYLGVLIVQPFFAVIAWSSVLAITCYPVHQRLVRQTGRVALSAFLTSILVVLAVVGPLVFVTGIAFTQLLALGTSLQESLQDQQRLAGRAIAAVEWLTARFGVDQDAVATWINLHAGDLARNAGQYTLTVARSVTGAIVSFVFVIFALFLLLRDGPRLLAKVPDLLPFERSRSEALLHRITDVVNGSVYGVVVIAVIQAVLLGLMFAILGIPSAALWGLTTLFTSVLPFLGAAAVWVPGAIYLGLTDHWVKAVVLAVWGSTIVSSVDNFLRPRLMAGRVGLSELVMFFALLGGLRAFGVLGIVLGPVIFAAAAAAIDVLSEPQPAPPPPSPSPSIEVAGDR